MKPLSEFAEGLRGKKAHSYSSENADHYRGFDAGMNHAGELLQAWLREADNAVHESVLSSGLSSGARLWIRLQLLGTLGTTQKPKQEGEK